MKLRFPLSDVQLVISTKKKQVEVPLYQDDYYTLNQTEFSMDVEEVGHFYAVDGKTIEIVPYPGVNQASLELYLNGSTYGAILHQRGILPMHGSCFVYQGKGVMLCGESGAGKSSLTTAFVQSGSHFLTDDVSPIIVEDGIPIILPLSDRVKLWPDSMKQLSLDTDEKTQIADWYQKYYLSIDKTDIDRHRLDTIFLIEKYEGPTVEFNELNGITKFTALRNQIYRWEYLNGMPETEKAYLEHLLSMSAQIPMVKIMRPETIQIEAFKQVLEELIKARLK